MIGALAYLQYHSVRNRLVSRFKRLRQPKYLFGAIVGGLYFYFYFFRYLFQGMGRHAAANPFTPPAGLFESLGALLLFVIVLLAWIVPHERAALTFTEAEIAFLFPAPVSRRTLIHFKLIRSQMAIFFTTLLLTLLSRRLVGNAALHALGWWLVLSTLNLHLMGASFTRTLLLDHGISNRLRRGLVFGLALAGGVFVWLWARQSVPPPTSENTADFSAIANYARLVLDSGPALYLLYPFHIAVRPFFAPDTTAFLTALVPAILLFALHYLGWSIPMWPSKKLPWPLRKNSSPVLPPSAPATGGRGDRTENPAANGSSSPAPVPLPWRCSGKI
jgi:ABC-2 type transport system permease protein